MKLQTSSSLVCGLKTIAPVFFSALLFFAGLSPAAYALNGANGGERTLEYALGVSQSSFAFDRAARSTSGTDNMLSISTTVADGWSASIVEQTPAGWLTLQNAFGEPTTAGQQGSTPVWLVFDENQTQRPRTAKIRISAGSFDCTVSVTQSSDAVGIQIKDAAGNADIEELLFAAPDGEMPSPKTFVLKWLPTSLPVYFSTVCGDSFGFPAIGQIAGGGMETITVAPANPSYAAGVHLSKTNPIVDIPSLTTTISYTQFVAGQTHNTRELNLKQQVWSAYLLRGDGLAGSEVSSLTPFQDEAGAVGAEQTVSIVAPEGASVLWSGIRESYHVNLRSVDGIVRVYGIRPVATLAKDSPEVQTTADCQISYEGKSIGRRLALTQRSEATPALQRIAPAGIYLMDGSTTSLTLRATTPVNTLLYLSTDDYDTAALAHLPATVQMINGTADIEITTINHIAGREILQKEVTLTVSDTPNGTVLGTATLHLVTPEAEANSYTFAPSRTSDIYIPLSQAFKSVDMPDARLFAEVVWRDNAKLNITTSIVGNYLRLTLNQANQQGKAVVGIRSEGSLKDYLWLWQIDVKDAPQMTEMTEMPVAPTANETANETVNDEQPEASESLVEGTEVAPLPLTQMPETPAPAASASPSFAIGNNLALDITGSLNVSLEFRTGNRTSLHVLASYNPYFEGETQRLKHYLLQPEYRVWTGSPFRGHFFGLHAHYAFYNVGGIATTWLKEHRVQGTLVGGGFSYGYQFNLLPRLNLETSLGAGYTYLDYNIYEKGTNGPLLRGETRNYFGLTRIGIAVSYVI